MTRRTKAQRFVAISFLLFCPGAAANSFDINLSDDSIQAVYGGAFGAAEVTAGGLWVDKDDNPWAAHLGLLVSGEPRSTASRSEAGLGGRLYYVSAGGNDAAALALGGQFRWFPGDGPVGVGAYGYYAPDIVTGLDAKRLWEAGARVELEVVRGTAHVYLGYRRMDVRLDNDTDVTVDKGGHVGVRIAF
jgi:hypothetical protein